MTLHINFLVSEDHPLYHKLRSIKENDGDLSGYIRGALTEYIDYPPEVIEYMNLKREIEMLKVWRDLKKEVEQEWR